MESCNISIRDINLYYPSALYNARTLKQAVFELAKLQKPKKRLDDVHALKNFSIEIKEGEKVGIIGSNGAGKSTLLKAIAGIYPLRTGEIEVNGSIRSMFELSLGFELDATGRENIMYRGLMLGETPESLRKKEQDIIDFAELGEFIDYPIKSYSAGMLVRLAFAISTMISGDILLLDEIFGAGDAAFINKARDRMMGLIESAKILVFVSHDFNSIKTLCRRVIWMNQGQMFMDGCPEEVISAYLKFVGA